MRLAYVQLAIAGGGDHSFVTTKNGRLVLKRSMSF